MVNGPGAMTDANHPQRWCALTGRFLFDEELVLLEYLVEFEYELDPCSRLGSSAAGDEGTGLMGRCCWGACRGLSAALQRLHANVAHECISVTAATRSHLAASSVELQASSHAHLQCCTLHERAFRTDRVRTQLMALRRQARCTPRRAPSASRRCALCCGRCCPGWRWQLTPRHCSCLPEMRCCWSGVSR